MEKIEMKQNRFAEPRIRNVFLPTSSYLQGNSYKIHEDWLTIFSQFSNERKNEIPSSLPGTLRLRNCCKTAFYPIKYKMLSSSTLKSTMILYDLYNATRSRTKNTCISLCLKFIRCWPLRQLSSYYSIRLNNSM